MDSVVITSMTLSGEVGWKACRGFMEKVIHYEAANKYGAMHTASVELGEQYTHA